MRKYNWRKILVGLCWVLSGAGIIVLLGAAMQKKDQKLCESVKVEITVVDKHMFIDEMDVMDILNASGKVAGTKISYLNLRAMESEVERTAWVSNAEMYFTNNQVLQVKIEERQPVARVFTLEGSSFYLDSGTLRLPLSDKLSAKVPVFTGFPSDKEKLSKPDSALLKNIVKLAKYILADSFWMAQVSQVVITPVSDFELIPVLGDHKVMLGNADELDHKFRRLFTFYQKAWLQNGMNTYEKLDVQYDKQVVAVKKGTAKAMVDSVKAIEIMKTMLTSTKTGWEDSSHLGGFTPATVELPAKDILKNTRPVLRVEKPPIKPVGKTKSNLIKYNKTNIKPLSNGMILKPATEQPLKKKPAAKLNQPKALMEKNQ